MFRTYGLILILSILAMPVFAENSMQSSAQYKSPKIILHFKTMFGVDNPFLSTSPDLDGPLPDDPVLRGILGDYSSWKINKSVEGKLFSDGKLIINIKGLIFGDGSDNDEDHFRALVSCQLTPDIPGVAPATFSTFITRPFPTGGPHNNPRLIRKGNAIINAKIPNFPDSCIAPVVMILNGDPAEGDVWFAVTGN